MSQAGGVAPKAKAQVEYLESVKKSGLVEADQLHRFLAQVKRDHGGIPDGVALGELLVAAGLVTPWQHEKLSKGRHKGFFLGRYRLLGLLGTGGMSSVFLAEHTLMRRRVAIKVLPVERNNTSSYRERFLLEAQAIASLDHPNIVQAFSVDKEGKVYYMVMEHVEGRDLCRIVAEDGPLSYARAAEYMRQSASGLAHAHSRGMIHRDIKPANLLVNQHDQIKILDMGLARLTGREKSLTIEHNENVLGTTDYLAPEQALDSHNVDARADLYSLGCSLYHVLVGHAPFPDGTLAQRLMKHQTERPKPISQFRADVPEELAEICDKLMAKKADDRYQSADEVVAVLTEWQRKAGKGVSEAGGDTATLSSTSDFRPPAGVKLEKPAPPPAPAAMQAAKGAAKQTPAKLAPGKHAEPAKAEKPVPKATIARPEAKSGDKALPAKPAVKAPAAKAGPAPAAPTKAVATGGDEALTGFLTNLNEDESSAAPARHAPASPKSSSKPSSATYRPREPLPPWVWLVGGVIVLGIFLLGVMGYRSSQDAKKREKDTPPKARSFQKVEWTPAPAKQ
jgi:serine/threonine-protein kinase